MKLILDYGQRAELLNGSFKRATVAIDLSGFTHQTKPKPQKTVLPRLNSNVRVDQISDHQIAAPPRQN